MAEPTTSSSSRGQKPPRSIVARVLAPLALAICVLAIFLVVSGTMTGEDESDEPAKERTRRADKAPKEYVVQEGETATAIAQKFKVPLSRILTLNPETDFQTLNAGETLKLR